MTLEEFYTEVCWHLDDLNSGSLGLEEFAYWINETVKKYSLELDI